MILISISIEKRITACKFSANPVRLISCTATTYTLLFLLQLDKNTVPTKSGHVNVEVTQLFCVKLFCMKQ
jgi:hypothetical protein